MFMIPSLLFKGLDVAIVLLKLPLCRFSTDLGTFSTSKLLSFSLSSVGWLLAEIWSFSKDLLVRNGTGVTLLLLAESASTRFVGLFGEVRTRGVP